MHCRIGIDPGITGALAVLGPDLGILEIHDMPTMQNGKATLVNPAAVKRILEKWVGKTDIVMLEQVNAMPGQGVTSMFNFGTSYGMVWGTVATMELPLMLIRPNTWKKTAGLLKKPKDAARALAISLYPGLAELDRKKDCGRADAILIARYGPFTFTK